MSNKKEHQKKSDGKQIPVVRLTEDELEQCQRMVDARRGHLEDEELKKTLTPQVKNADNDYLGELPFIAQVPEVAGQGGAEVPEFIPTQHEVLQILKYWYGEYLGNQWFWFRWSSTGSDECTTNAFAVRRIARIEELLGKEEVKEAIDEVEEELREQVSTEVNPKYLDIFMHGDAEQIEAARKEIAGDEELYNYGTKEKENLGA